MEPQNNVLDNYHKAMEELFRVDLEKKKNLLKYIKFTNTISDGELKPEPMETEDDDNYNQILESFQRQIGVLKLLAKKAKCPASNLIDKM